MLDKVVFRAPGSEPLLLPGGGSVSTQSDNHGPGGPGPPADWLIGQVSSGQAAAEGDSVWRRGRCDMVRASDKSGLSPEEDMQEMVGVVVGEQSTDVKWSCLPGRVQIADSWEGNTSLSG